MKKRILLSLGLFAVLFIFPASAYAHRPVWGEALGPIEVDNISISYAFYQTLQLEEIEVFYFEGQKGDDLHAGIQIPDVNEYQNYGVSMALFGPGLPVADEDLLPPEHPEGLGAIILASEISEDFYEPFTQTNYLGRQKLDLALPETGTYYIIIWHPNGAAGKYVMDVGYREQFGLLDLFVFPFWWARVHWYFEHYVLVISLTLFAVFGSVFLLYRRFQARKG